MFNKTPENKIDPDKPETWTTKGQVRKQLQKWAEEADWNGETIKAKSLYALLEGMSATDDHELHVPF